MNVVDRNRCAYCGGCVSVCTVETLRSAETRLEDTDERFVRAFDLATSG